MTNKILISLSLMTAVTMAVPSIANAQYGQVLGTYGQVLSSESPDEVDIVHEVKAAGIGDIFNPAAVTGGLLVSTGMYLYFDRKRKQSLKDFSYIK